MTKSKLFYTIALALLGVGLVYSEAFTQGRGAAAPAPAHKVGLIDIEEVFTNYEKFKILQEDLKVEAEQSSQTVQRMVKQLKQTEQKLKSPTLKKGSAEYIDLEATFVKQKAALDADVKNKERDFMRSRAKVFKTVHEEVQEMVQAFAQKKGYTLIIRFRRPKFDVDDPRAVAMDLNSLVIYHRDADDITDVIAKALNRVYADSKRDSNVRPAGGRAPARTRQPAAPRRRQN